MRQGLVDLFEPGVCHAGLVSAVAEVGGFGHAAVFQDGLAVGTF